MTELLYLASSEAAYLRRFSAEVVALPPGGVVLDRTAFYPVGGGQPADRGTLSRTDGASWNVVDVARHGSYVLHRLGKGARGAGLPGIGESLEGEIDWPRRYLHMRYHTGQHLLSARIFALTGLRTRKAVFGSSGGRVELEGPWPLSVPFASLSGDVAGWLARGLSVRLRTVPRAEYDRAPASRSGLVPLAPQVDPVRLVEIDPADSCPCGGTHVRSTSEVGPLEIALPRPLAGGGCEVAFTVAPSAPATPSA